MSEDRSVHTDALKTLGTIISASEQRDAIHLAVEPTTAQERLKPGQHVGVDGTRNKPVGIVDPFLAVDVLPGERFWLIVYPRTITSLRHVWEHSAFPDALVKQSDKSASEKWMRAWAMEHMSDDDYGDGDKVDEDTAFNYAIYAGENLSVGSHEDARDHIDNEWWAHWEIITGKSGRRGEYFRCAC